MWPNRFSSIAPCHNIFMLNKVENLQNYTILILQKRKIFSLVNLYILIVLLFYNENNVR